MASDQWTTDLVAKVNAALPQLFRAEGSIRIAENVVAICTADLAARVEAERVACIAVARDDRNIGIGGDATAGMIANAIRALGPNSAYDAAIKAAETRGMEAAEDTALLNWLRDNSCDLRCVDVPTGGDDCDIDWIVVSHFQAEPQEREVGRSFIDDPRPAIRAATRAAAGGGE